MFNTSVITVTFLKQFLNKSINFARIFPLIRTFQLLFKNHCRELVSWIKGINGEKSLFTEIAKNKYKKREKKLHFQPTASCLNEMSSLKIIDFPNDNFEKFCNNILKILQNCGNALSL